MGHQTTSFKSQTENVANPFIPHLLWSWLALCLGKLNLTILHLQVSLSKREFTKAPAELRKIQIHITAKASDWQALKCTAPFSFSSCYFRGKSTITFFLVLHHVWHRSWHSKLLTSVSSAKIKSISSFILTLCYFKTWLWTRSHIDTVVWTQLSILARWHS